MKKLNKFLGSSFCLFTIFALQVAPVKAIPDKVPTKIGLLECIKSESKFHRDDEHVYYCRLREKLIAQIEYEILKTGDGLWNIWKKDGNKGEPFGVLKHLWICKDAQNNGIGSSLFKLVVEDLQKRDISLMRWKAHGDAGKLDSLLKFYKSFGAEVYQQYYDIYAFMELDIPKNQSEKND